MTFQLPVRHLLKVVSPAVTWKEVRRFRAWQVPTDRLSQQPDGRASHAATFTTAIIT
jgi:hypothetical protein